MMLGFDGLAAGAAESAASARSRRGNAQKRAEGKEFIVEGGGRYLARFFWVPGARGGLREAGRALFNGSSAEGRLRECSMVLRG